MDWSSQPKPSQPRASFQPLQIVCLEHKGSCLYAEVIQMVESRQTCWVRPLVLAESKAEPCQLEAVISPEPIIYDLRQGADLLLPATLFRMALDTEALPVLAMLGGLAPPENLQPIMHLRLNQFIKQLCLANTALFNSETV